MARTKKTKRWPKETAAAKKVDLEESVSDFCALFVAQLNVSFLFCFHYKKVIEVSFLDFIQGEGTQDLMLVLDTSSSSSEEEEEQMEHGQVLPTTSQEDDDEDIVDLGSFPAKYPSKFTSAPSTSAVSAPPPKPSASDVMTVSSSSDEEKGASAPRKPSQSTTVRNIIEVNTFFCQKLAKLKKKKITLLFLTAKKRKIS